MIVEDRKQSAVGQIVGYEPAWNEADPLAFANCAQRQNPAIKQKSGLGMPDRLASIALLEMPRSRSAFQRRGNQIVASKLFDAVRHRPAPDVFRCGAEHYVLRA